MKNKTDNIHKTLDIIARNLGTMLVPTLIRMLLALDTISIYAYLLLLFHKALSAIKPTHNLI